MKQSMSFFVLAPLLTFGLSANASSKYQICSDSSGLVSVENGDVTIRNGVGDGALGPAQSQVVIKRISQTDENCVDGPNYVSTYVTVEKVTYYSKEEGPADSSIVLCTTTTTGMVSPGTTCK